MSRPLQVLIPALVALALSMASAAWWGTPVASNHDEYSYLLAADTFAHGRLTNPPHPLWEHFERFHVLQQPTRFSKYPTGQGLLLALGQTLGHPIVGVWLGIAGLAAAVAWLVAGFFRHPWPLVGGLAAAGLFALPNYWVLSYWGGALAAVGGALAFGALPRMLADDGRVSAPGLFGLGLVLLALSRPLEGLVFGVACGGILLRGLTQRHADVRRPLLRRWLLGAAPLLAIGAAWLLVHNDAVTGDPLTLPYQVYEEQYAMVPQMVWMEPGEPPAYRHLVHLRFHLSVRARFEMFQDPAELLYADGRRLLHFWRFFLGWTFLGPFLAAPLLAGTHRRWTLAALLAIGLLALLFASYQSFHPHYAAPLAGPTLFVAVAGLRRLLRGLLRRLRHRLPLPRRSRALALGLVLFLAAGERLWVYDDHYLALDREKTAPTVQALLEDRLREEGGRHLILVRLGPEASFYDEWIANGADLDSQAVIWAHDMGAARNGPLLEHYAGRDVWLLAVGADPRQARLRKVRDALGSGEIRSGEIGSLSPAGVSSGGRRSSR